MWITNKLLFDHMWSWISTVTSWMSGPSLTLLSFSSKFLTCFFSFLIFGFCVSTWDYQQYYQQHVQKSAHFKPFVRSTIDIYWSRRLISSFQLSLPLKVLWLRGSQCPVIWRLLVQFPWSASQIVLEEDTESQTAPDVLVGKLCGSHNH